MCGVTSQLSHVWSVGTLGPWKHCREALVDVCVSVGAAPRGKVCAVTTYIQKQNTVLFCGKAYNRHTHTTVPTVNSTAACTVPSRRSTANTVQYRCLTDELLGSEIQVYPIELSMTGIATRSTKPSQPNQSKHSENVTSHGGLS